MRLNMRHGVHPVELSAEGAPAAVTSLSNDGAVCVRAEWCRHAGRMCRPLRVKGGRARREQRAICVRFTLGSRPWADIPPGPLAAGAGHRGVGVVTIAGTLVLLVRLASSALGKWCPALRRQRRQSRFHRWRRPLPRGAARLRWRGGAGGETAMHKQALMLAAVLIFAAANSTSAWAGWGCAYNSNGGVGRVWVVDTEEHPRAGALQNCTNSELKDCRIISCRANVNSCYSAWKIAPLSGGIGVQNWPPEV